jgi:hypothetical protein
MGRDFGAARRPRPPAALPSGVIIHSRNRRARWYTSRVPKQSRDEDDAEGDADGGAPESSEPPAKAKKNEAPPAKAKKAAPIGALIGVAVLLAILLVPWLLRSTIATSMASGQLQAAGVSCDDRFAVEVAAFFGSATIGPTRCTMERGHVQAVELLTPAEVELSGFSPSQITVDQLRLTLRSDDVRGGSGWDAELRQLRLEQRVAALVKGLGELSELDLPAASAARVEVMHGDDTMARINALTSTADSPMGVRIESVEFSAVNGAARLTLTGVSGSAEQSTVHLEGGAIARAGISFLGITREGTFQLDATGLDGSSPRFALRSTL